VFAEFEREILRERAGLALARQQGQTPRPSAIRSSQSRRSPKAARARQQQI
jgi:DNA invertase Pin-like site-specific DNA recombinase